MTPEITSLYVHRYAKSGLAAMPDVLENLLGSLPPEKLDARPDPNRFTLREMMAHLADWDTVWMERLRTMQTETNPAFPATNMDARAAEKNYATSDLAHSLNLFRTNRAALIQFLDTLPDADLSRTSQFSTFKTITIAELVGFILGHDGYHLLQITDFRKALGTR